MTYTYKILFHIFSFIYFFFCRIYLDTVKLIVKVNKCYLLLYKIIKRGIGSLLTSFASKLLLFNEIICSVVGSCIPCLWRCAKNKIIVARVL